MLKISQSVINDFLYNSMSEKAPASCPLFLKYRHIDKLETPCSEVMLAGRYFEWHLLGATRDGQEPILPRINIKDLRPTKTATKEIMSAYLESKGVFLNGTKDFLYERILTYPPEFTKGDPSTRQREIDAIIVIAKQVLERMGLDTTKGEKQLRLEAGDTIGHIDWRTVDFANPSRLALYDVKYTETQEDDRFNGWADFQERSDAQVEKARTQAGQYIVLHHEQTGDYIPFYFILFGRSGWIKIIKMTMLESGLADIQSKQDITRDKIAEFEKKKWKAKPEYNKCLACPYAAYQVNGETLLCPSRSIIPSVEEVQF